MRCEFRPSYLCPAHTAQGSKCTSSASHPFDDPTKLADIRPTQQPVIDKHISSPQPTECSPNPPWLLRRGETRSKTPPGGRYARTHQPTRPVLAVSFGTLTLSSTPCCRRARSRGSPRACARRTSSRASPSGSSWASSSTFPRRGDPSPAPRRLRARQPRGAPAPSGRRGVRLPQAARSLRW